MGVSLILKNLICCALAVGVLPAWADTSKDLIANEIKMTTALRTKDKATFTSLVAKDGQSLEPTGLMPVSQFVAAWKDLRINSLSLSNARVIVLTPDSAVVVAKIEQEGSLMGKPFPAQVQSSTIWVRRKGKWQAVLHQEIPLR